MCVGGQEKGNGEKEMGGVSPVSLTHQPLITDLNADFLNIGVFFIYLFFIFNGMRLQDHLLGHLNML